jgi:hypothetical protein
MHGQQGLLTLNIGLNVSVPSQVHVVVGDLSSNAMN